MNSASHPALSARNTRLSTYLREHAHWLILSACSLLLLPLCYQIGWLRSWYRSDSPEAYQPLIPLGALALAWIRRDRIVAAATALTEPTEEEHEDEILQVTQAPPRARPGSIVPVILGCILMAFNHLWRYQEISVIALMVLIAGAILYLYGSGMLRVLRAPLLFLFLMAPLPRLITSHASQMLQVNSTQIAGNFLQTLKVPVGIEGNTLVLPHARLEVTAACGGIGIVLALQIMAIWLLAMHRPSFIQCVALLSFVTMLALVTNMLRIMTMGLIALRWPALATRLHDANSWLFTLLLFGLTYGISRRMGILPQWTSSKPSLSNAS